MGVTPTEIKLMRVESGFKATAKNPTSSAKGLGQLIIANRIEQAGKNNWSPETIVLPQQIQMMRGYVQDSRHGTIERAWKFWQENNWY